MISRLLCSLCLGVGGRRARRATDSAVSDRAPLEACPPALGRLTSPPRAGVRAWLRARWHDSLGVGTTATPHRAQRRPERLAAPLTTVRADFTEALVGEQAPAAAALLGRIVVARSIRELRHLRADVYTVVACLHGEAEAQQRVRRLDRHFSTRSSTVSPIHGDRSAAL